MGRYIKEKSDIGILLQEAIKDAGMTKKDVAHKIGIDEGQMYSQFSKNMKSDKIFAILDAIGYEMVLRPSRGMELAILETEKTSTDKCRYCKHKVFSETMKIAVQKLQDDCGESGEVIDFN